MKQFKQKCVCGIIMSLFLSASAYCIDIVVMPISYYELEGNNLVKKEYEKDIRTDLADRLNRYYNVQFDNTPLNDRLAGATESDARRVAEFYQTNYVLYGIIRKERNSLYAELKLYNAQQKKSEVFFAADAPDQFDRLIKNVSENILDWFHTDRDKLDAVKNEIAILRQEMESMKADTKGRRKQDSEDPPGEPPVKEFTLRIPVKAGYWTYVKNDWVDFVQGTVEATLGVEIVPELQFPSIGGMRNELSIGLLFGYRYGTSARENVSLNVHDIVINPVLTYHLNCYTNNWILFGIGAFFEVDIWHIEEEQYNHVTDSIETLTGLSLLLGYSYRINRRVTIDIGLNSYFYFTADTSPVLRPFLGTSVTLLGGMYEK
ncbi:hypothetical protein K7I13_11020 [Brucepastera parasyntrophica]|uniref:hypothetical protein n=1 Tax=Brucepastera parasyntrophica TaxID=2880008 RepID=UPI0021095685|nr:hypothetical protein [Brucepastera parasyntrophica]ULQ59039.1 hypothetical protein K7I13_11020 [Brucepastera parasyntrophica]